MSRQQGNQGNIRVRVHESDTSQLGLECSLDNVNDWDSKIKKMSQWWGYFVTDHLRCKLYNVMKGIRQEWAEQAGICKQSSNEGL